MKSGFLADMRVLQVQFPAMNTAALTPFARAKIQQPRLRIEQIARPALELRLAQALGERALVLISAPAGYGKTVLLSRVLGEARDDRAVAWISADEDDDLQRLLLAMVTALEPYDLPWRVAPEALGALAADGQRLALDALLEALAGTDAKRGILVIEDVHRLCDSRVFEWLDRLIERLPFNWCLALTSRIDPPLALARLRARGELLEFRAEELRFTREEAFDLAMSIAGTNAAEVESLWQRTHGWPVGLSLALRTGHATLAGWVADRHTFDYLASEVLEQMPPPLQAFLVRCAVLPELNAGRCAAVSGDPKAGQWLEEIERRGLFVTALEGAERTLRLHDLFRDFLDEQLQRRHSEELPQLLRRAAAGESDPVRRVGYLLRAGEFDEAGQVLVAATPAMLLDGAAAQVLRLLDLFPPPLRDTAPSLAFVRGLCAWPNFDWVTLQQTMGAAADGFERGGHPDQAQQARLFETLALISQGRLEEAGKGLGMVHSLPLSHEAATFNELVTCWYTTACGPQEAPAHHLGRMLDLLSQGGSPELWYRCAPHFIFLGHPGVSPQFARYTALAARYTDEEHPYLRATVSSLKAWLLLWDGRLDEAEELIRAVQEEERWLGRPNNLRISIAVFLGLLHALRGERDECLAAREMAAAVDRDAERRSAWLGVNLYHQSRWSLALGDWDAVEAVTRQLNATPAAGEWPFMQVSRPAANALWALHGGDAQTACALLEPLLPLADRYDMSASRSLVRVTLGLAYARLGRLRQAWETVAPAVALARLPGERLTLLLVGTEMLSELAALPWQEDAPAPEREWLREIAAFSASLRRHRRENPAAEQPALHSLSDREQEVLALIAEGASNKLIARALDISPHTVKRHVANILDKLALATRGQAAAWWHAHRSSSPPT